MRSLDWISLVTVALPPAHANTGRFNEPKRLTSCRRPERMGPTSGAAWLWNTNAKRETFALMISS